MESVEAIVALPVRLSKTPNGVLVKRGSVEFLVQGERAEEVVVTLLDAARSGVVTLDALEALFPQSDRPSIRSLLGEFIRRRILVRRSEYREDYFPEDPSDIFYWHFDRRMEGDIDNIISKNITVLGINSIADSLVLSLRECGVGSISVVDVPSLRGADFSKASRPVAGLDLREIAIDPKHWEEKLVTEKPYCVVATSATGSQQSLREWNKYCVKYGVVFLPVVLQDLIGYIGPLVIPGETPCLECLRARQNAALLDPATRRAGEMGISGLPNIAGFLPPMASAVGAIAAVELLKFLANIPQWMVGALIEVNMVAGSMKSRKVLRVPRCEICSHLNEISSFSIDREDPGQSLDFG